jgi:hypothetical protein
VLELELDEVTAGDLLDDLIVKGRLHAGDLLDGTTSLGCGGVRARGDTLARGEESAGVLL